MQDEYYDVVIVGAGPAGAVAGSLISKLGLTTLLVERRTSPEIHKKLCGHYILGSAYHVLDRIGANERILASGGVPSITRAWSRNGGWILDPDSTVPKAISLQRESLDPLLRAIVENTEGCTVEYGASIVGTEQRQGASIRSVTLSSIRGVSRRVSTSLLVGADGSNSKTSQVLNIRKTSTPNNRFMYWAYFRNATLHDSTAAHIWMLDPDVAVAFPTNEGLVQVGYFGHKRSIPDVEEMGILEFIRSKIEVLPDAPDLSDAVLEKGPVGTSNYPLLERPCVPAPSVALIGDAALTSDPVAAVGCSWAMRSAEFLADALVGFAAGSTSINSCLQQYERRHSFLSKHHRMISIDSRRVVKANLIQRRVRGSATRNRYIANEMGQYISQNRSVYSLLKPSMLRRVVMSRAAREEIVREN